MYNRLQSDIQNAIIAAIDNPNFHFDLPNLSETSLEPLLSYSPYERERLEFVGDGLLHSVIGVGLYELFPLESPHFYTTLRSCLNSNATFARLIAKVGVHELSSSNTKKAADAFEMCIAAYYMEHDFEALCLWVRNRFRPLILAAGSVFYNFRRWEASLSNPLNERRRGDIEHKMANVAFYTKLQRPEKHKILARYNFKRLLQHRSRSPGISRARATATSSTSRIWAPATPTPTLFVTPRSKNLPPAQPPSVTKMETIIDLTLDSDSEDDTEDEHEVEAAINTQATNTARVSRRFVSTGTGPGYRVPPPDDYSPSSLPPIANRDNKLLVTFTPGPTKDHPLSASGSHLVVGTSANPITIDNSSDEDG